MLATFIITFPSLYLRATGLHPDPIAEALVFGLGILGAAFLLSWAAEVVQMDLSQGFALAILALIAILPEYAVDLYFAWVAADQPHYAAYATANMTGANRLLVGGGWPLIVFLFYFCSRKVNLELPQTSRVEICFLGIATLYAFTIPVKGGLDLIDCAVLVGLFALYAWRTAVMPVHEPELVGPAYLISRLSKKNRRLVNVFLFAYAGVVILVSAEPFAESLIHTGKQFGIDEFFLVQWLAPIASEAPEFIIAAIWTLRNHAQAALSALISSKVNQWTLLVGTIPLVYSINLGEPGTLPMDARQQSEILLTAAQSIFATFILMNLGISVAEAVLLFVLFFIQMVYPPIHTEVAYVYLALTVILLFKRRYEVIPTLKATLSWKKLNKD